MKLKFFLSLFLAVLLAVLVTHTIVTAQTSNQPVEVRVTLAPSVGEFKIVSSQTTFTPGVRYHFVVRNAGRKLHEFLVMPRGESDTRRALVAIEEDYLRPNAVAVRNLKFSKPGDYEFACRYGNHYEKGMVLPINVK